MPIVHNTYLSENVCFFLLSALSFIVASAWNMCAQKYFSFPDSTWKEIAKYAILITIIAIFVATFIARICNRTKQHEDRLVWNRSKKTSDNMTNNRVSTSTTE